MDEPPVVSPLAGRVGTHKFQVVAKKKVAVGNSPQEMWWMLMYCHKVEKDFRLLLQRRHAEALTGFDIN